MSLLHQSPAACRDSLVIFQHIFYACGMSGVIRREGLLISQFGSVDFSLHANDDDEAVATETPHDGLPVRGKSAPTESVSACRGWRSACHRSTSERHGEK